MGFSFENDPILILIKNQFDSKVEYERRNESNSRFMPGISEKILKITESRKKIWKISDLGILKNLGISEKNT